MYRNALTIKCSFGGGKRGCLGIVATPAAFRIEAGSDWIVPASQGSYPNFPAGASEFDKKVLISEFILQETDIRKVEVVHELLKNQFIDCIDESYIRELCDGMREYDATTLQELIEHVFSNYGRMDDHLVNQNRTRWDEPPDMDLPIDAYFAK